MGRNVLREPTGIPNLKSSLFSFSFYQHPIIVIFEPLNAFKGERILFGLCIKCVWLRKGLEFQCKLQISRLYLLDWTQRRMYILRKLIDEPLSLIAMNFIRIIVSGKNSIDVFFVFFFRYRRRVVMHVRRAPSFEEKIQSNI